MKKVVVTNQSTVTVGGVPPGGSIAIDTDDVGVPLDAFWRRRVRDAALDGSLRVDPEEPAPKLADAPVPDAEPTPTRAVATKKDKTK